MERSSPDRGARPARLTEQLDQPRRWKSEFRNAAPGGGREPRPRFAEDFIWTLARRPQGTWRAERMTASRPVALTSTFGLDRSTQRRIGRGRDGPVRRHGSWWSSPRVAAGSSVCRYAAAEVARSTWILDARMGRRRDSVSRTGGGPAGGRRGRCDIVQALAAAHPRRSAARVDPHRRASQARAAAVLRLEPGSTLSGVSAPDSRGQPAVRSPHGAPLGQVAV